MAGAWRVRRAVPEDVPVLHALVRELAEFEREPDAVTASPEDLRAALFGEHPRVHAHVVELPVEDPADDPAEGPPQGPGAADGRTWQVVGSAVWFTSYSTWTGRHGTWLEDLCVSPSHRGKGLGRALLAALAAEAVARGDTRVEWSVLDWNTPAQGLYASVGARPMQEWTTWRLSGAELEELGRSAGADRPPGSTDRDEQGTMEESVAVTEL